jgi:hypothetical protein
MNGGVRTPFRVPTKHGNSASGDPYLISNDGHHEYEVEAESPEDQEFGAFEVAAGNGVLPAFDQLMGVVFLPSSQSPCLRSAYLPPTAARGCVNKNDLEMFCVTVAKSSRDQCW